MTEDDIRDQEKAMIYLAISYFLAFLAGYLLS